MFEVLREECALQEALCGVRGRAQETIEDEERFEMKALGLVVFAIVLCIACAFIEGIAVHFSWKWFIEPWLHALGPTIGQSAGVMMLVGLLYPRSRKDKNERGELDVEGLVFPFLRAVMVLVCVWLIHLVVGA